MAQFRQRQEGTDCQYCRLPARGPQCLQWTPVDEYPQYQPEPIQQVMQQPSYNGPPVYSLYEVGSVNNSGLHSQSV
eukprot:2552842-Amphidinium_carterae.1